MNQYTESMLHRLTPVLGFPLRFIPVSVHSRLAALVLNRVFAAQIEQGLLDFLDGRIIAIEVRDLQLGFYLGFRSDSRARRLTAAAGTREPDLLLQAGVHEYLLLAAGEEDPDTLVFQRRLSIQGDTELGLMLKNFIDGIELEPGSIPEHIVSILRRLLKIR